MGTYLSTPVLDKHTEKGSDLSDANTPVRWAVVDMQGWRKSMEDAHVARTDVALPGCCVPKGGDDGGGGKESGEAAAEGEGNTSMTNSSHAKVFAVFDGHGGAEVARFCQLRLVPVLTSQREWADSGASGEEEDGENLNMNMASRIGQALIHSFHALDRLIDDPDMRGEVDKWRSERPPPYVPSEAGEEKKEETEPEAEAKPPTEAEDVGEGELQSRRHTAMDPSEIGEDAAKVEHLMDAGEEGEESSSTAEEGAAIEKGTAIEEDEKDASLSNMLDDEDDAIFEDSVSEPHELENEASEGVVRDDSDDEKEEKGSAAEGDDGEVDEEVEGAPKKEAGTMVLSANDAVALFQKLLHMNGSGDDEEDDDEEEGEADANGEKMNETAGDEGNDKGEEAELVIPTKEQLLNPPTGIVAPSASVPTRIQNGRKICNLPDHPVHAGCTSVVAVIVGRTLVVANAGDSRAVICRAGGLTEPLSFDHKPMQNREMNRITNAGGFVNQFGRVNGNLNLSRSIGDMKYKQVPGISPAEQMITAEPDILSTNLRDGDEFIILGCDGIWDVLTNEECVKYVRDRIDAKRPHEIGAEMLDDIVSADPRASQGIGGDNMTIMIVDLQPQSRPYNEEC